MPPERATKRQLAKADLYGDESQLFHNNSSRLSAPRLCRYARLVRAMSAKSNSVKRTGIKEATLQTSAIPSSIPSNGAPKCVPGACFALPSARRLLQIHCVRSSPYPQEATGRSLRQIRRSWSSRLIGRLPNRGQEVDSFTKECHKHSTPTLFDLHPVQLYTEAY